MSWNVFKPYEPLFFLSGIVHSRREKIDCNENLKVWTGIWEDLDKRMICYRFVILDWSFVTLIFPGRRLLFNR